MSAKIFVVSLFVTEKIVFSKQTGDEFYIVLIWWLFGDYFLSLYFSYKTVTNLHQKIRWQKAHFPLVVISKQPTTSIK